MTTNAIVGLRTTLAFNGNTIGEVVSVSGTRTRRVAEILSCDSTDQAVERIAASLDEGEMTFNCYYDQTAGGSYNDLNTDYQAGTLGTGTITYTSAASDSSTHSGTGIITSLSVPEFGGPDDPVMITVTIAASGKWTYTDVA